MGDLRTALVAIQELHVPYVIHDGSQICIRCGLKYPCPTRKLADEGLTDRMARTNQGENK